MRDFDLAAFGMLAAAMGGGRDAGASFPQSDADDLGRGARFIPGEVTMARRRGEHVAFVTSCGPCCWYWEMEDGSRIFHYDPTEHARLKAASESGEAAKCEHCGNEHVRGGTAPTLAGFVRKSRRDEIVPYDAFGRRGLRRF